MWPLPAEPFFQGQEVSGHQPVSSLPSLQSPSQKDGRGGEEGVLELQL